MILETLIGTQFQSGEICKIPGKYCFDGYKDGTSRPSPMLGEWEIQVAYNEVFPPVRSCNRACQWVLVSSE